MLKKNNNDQKARDNAMQIQTGNIIFGIDEKRVREIIDEKNREVLNQVVMFSKDIINDRLNDYSNILVPKLVREGLLSCFVDPSIQITFRESELTAICTDKNKDYELLSELLIHRIKKSGDFTKCSAIKKAISEINNISNEALLGLTLTFAIFYFIPTTYDVKNGLRTIDELFSKIIGDDDLPVNNEWVENLEIVGAIHTNTMLSWDKFGDFFIKNLNGYFCRGIKKGSESYFEALKMLEKVGIPDSIFVESIYDSEYVRLKLSQLNFYNEITLNNMKLTDEQCSVLSSISSMYEDCSIYAEKYILLLDEYENIKKVCNWWNSNMIHNNFKISAIGRVIAHTNAKSIDASLPDLD